MDSSPPRHASQHATAAALTTTTSKSNVPTPSSGPTSAAGTKRPAASLLPAFEPLSSSPALPRPLKRQNTGSAHLKYPTPVPTSSTGILSSSPPRLARSTSERVPLSAVRTFELPENGDTVAFGRSSNSSQFQLSANRLVSRVHVKVRYIAAASPLESNKIEIICNGWNGLKLHCQGREWELYKGDSFTSETEGTDIMLDVLEARVLIQWPRRAVESLSDSSWDDSPRSQRRNSVLQSSPLRRTTRIASPESPTPVGAGSFTSSQRLQALSRDDNIQIYEDEPELPAPKDTNQVDPGVSMRTEATASFSSELSDPEDEQDPDEENDPVVHSFGPFGANIAGRMASISTMSPRAKPLASIEQEDGAAAQLPSSPPLTDESKETTPKVVDTAVTNHIINQLAFSRLSSTPLSAIMQNLPTGLKTGLAKDVLRDAIEATTCIGIIERQGKDAAGKALESEYYYVPERDDDEQRRAAVVDGLRKPSLRNCRKQHKVCRFRLRARAFY